MAMTPKQTFWAKVAAVAVLAALVAWFIPDNKYTKYVVFVKPKPAGTSTGAGAGNGTT